MPPLSVLIPTLNEETQIEACIRSLGGLNPAELVVLDSFSSDRTAEIARGLGAKIIQRRFDNYASQKNWGLEQLKGDWVLILDADERLTEGLREEIAAVFSGPPDCDGYWIRRDTFFLGKRVRCWSGDTVLRLFRRDKGRYPEGKLVHEEINLRGRAGRLRHAMEHHTFRSYAQYMAKADSFAALAAAEAFRKGRRVTFFGLLFRPKLHFLKAYFLRGGILDGTRGLLIAWLSACTTYLKYARLWELQQAERGHDR